MVSPSVKQELYARGVTISDIAREQGVPARTAGKAIERWQGKTGNPRGKTRKILKAIEAIIGRPVYQEAGWESELWNG